MNIIVTATISTPMPLNKLWVIVTGSTKVFFVLPAFIFSLSALGLIHLFLKKVGWCLDTFWCYPSHNRGLVLHILGSRYRPKMCITGPKCFWTPPKWRHVLDRQMANKRKKEIGSTFVLLAIRTHSFLMSSSPALSSSHYHTSDWDNP